jgi:hypothetical protein
MSNTLSRRKLSIQKHIQTRYCNTLTPGINLSFRPRFLKLPLVTRTSIQQYRNDKQIYQSTSLFFSVLSVVFPAEIQVVDARDAADVEVLPAAVGWDC